MFVFSRFRYSCMEKHDLETEPFEKVKDQIGFCGIWCGSCGGGNGVVQELARRFEEVTKNCRLEKWAPKEINFGEFTRGLACIQKTSSCIGCQKGGGPPTCKIRICALNKHIANCSQCVELAECKNFEHLEKGYPKIKEGLMEIKDKDRANVIAKWTGELKNRWPHCILLCPSAKK